MALNLLDITANNNDLTNSGATEITTGLPFAQSTSAAKCDGANYLYAGDSASLSISGDFTIELWVRFISIGTSGGAFGLVCKWNNLTDNREYALSTIQNAGDDKLRLYVSSDGGGINFESQEVTWNPVIDTWYHVACTFAAATKKYNFYVNGSQLGTEQTGASITSIFNGNSNVRITHADGAFAALDADVDDVRIWNDVRTPTEISNNYNIELVGNEANLVAYWPFETTLGTTTSTSTTSTSTSSSTSTTSTSSSTSTTSTSSSTSSSTSTTSTSTSSSTSTTSTSTSSSTSTTSTSSSTSSSTSTTSTSSSTSSSTSTTSTSTSTSTTSTSSSTSSSTSTSTTTTWIYPFIVDSGLASNQAEMSFKVDPEEDKSFKVDTGV